MLIKNFFQARSSKTNQRFIWSNSGISGGYQKIKILDKSPRESTDLEEYVFLVSKNII